MYNSLSGLEYSMKEFWIVRLNVQNVLWRSVRLPILTKLLLDQPHLSPHREVHALPIP